MVASIASQPEFAAAQRRVAVPKGRDRDQRALSPGAVARELIFGTRIQAGAPLVSSMRPARKQARQ